METPLESLQKLADFYAPFNKKLAEYLGDDRYLKWNDSWKKPTQQGIKTA